MLEANPISMSLPKSACVYDARLITAEYSCHNMLTISGIYYNATPSLHEVAEWVCKSYENYKSYLVTSGFTESELRFFDFIANLTCRDYIQLASNMPYTPAHHIIVSEGKIKFERETGARFNLYGISGTPGKGFVFEITSTHPISQRVFEFVSSDYRDIVHIVFDDANEVAKMCKRGKNMKNLGDITRYYIRHVFHVPIRARYIGATVGWLKCYNTVVHGMRCDMSIDLYNTALELEEDMARRVARHAIELGARDVWYGPKTMHLYYVPREHVNMLLDMIGGGKFQMD